MNGFIYYVNDPGRQQLTLDELQAWGLGYAFDERPTFRGCHSGPDDGQGLTFADSRIGGLGYAPDGQTWRKIPPALLADEAPPIHVGYFNERRPGPADLERRRTLAGHLVELGDGEKWLCPAAIAVDEDAEEFNPQGRLPAVSDVDENGKWQTSAVRAELAELWTIATTFFDRFMAGVEVEGGIKFDFDGIHESAVAAITANYRIGPIECAMLRLLDEHACIEVLQALIDWPTSKAWMQKKREREAAGEDSSAGPEG